MDLTIRPGRIVSVNRSTFKLEIFRWYQLTGTWKIELQCRVGVGAVGHDTPHGLYLVDAKSDHPSWKAPDADWVPVELRGKILPFDNPTNPFAGGFISLHESAGVGIHGTKFDPEVGGRVSHGCIRVTVPSFKKIWPLVRVGTPVMLV